MSNPALSKPKKNSANNRAEAIRDTITGWLFISPAILIIGLFGIFPIVYAFYMSFYRWRIKQGAFLCDVEGQFQFGACFNNYTKTIGSWEGAIFFALGFLIIVLSWLAWGRIFITAEGKRRQWMPDIPPLVKLIVAFIVVAVGLYFVVYGWGLMTSLGDKDYLESIIITFYYAIGSIPLQLALGLLLAYVLYQNIAGKEFYRMIFFLPYITPAVAAATVFGIIFTSRETGLANQFIRLFGFDPQRWVAEADPFLNTMFGVNLTGFLAGPSMALVSVILLGIWTYTGYNAIIFLAGLGNIPKDLYEAARVDGANDVQIFFGITLPLISPITLYLSILGFIGTFKAFNTIFVMRRAESLGTTDTASVVIFDTFFKSSQYGEATAQAIILMLIILAITQFQRSVLEKSVFYG